MAIDPSIALQIRQPESPLDHLNKLAQFTGAQQERQIRQQQMQQNALGLKTQQQGVDDATAARNAAQGAVGTDGQLDRQKFFANLQSSAPHLIPQFQQEFAKLDDETAKAKIANNTAENSNQAAKLANASKVIDMIGQHAQAALAAPVPLRRQAITGSLQQLTQAGVIPPDQAQSIGQQVSQMNDDQLGQWLQQHAASAVTAKDQITAQLDKLKHDEVVRHDQADEANTKRGQDITAGTARRGQDMQYGAFQANIPAGVTGTQALLAMNPNMASTVKAIGDGKLDFATITSRMPPAVKANLAAAVLAYKPDYDQRNFSVGKKELENVTSGNLSKSLLAIETARQHMPVFKQLADALNNGDVQAANQIGNAFGVQFGSDKATNFKIAAQAFGGEVGKALDGAGVTEGERKQASDAFNAAMSPGQFKGAVDTVDKLLQGKQQAAKNSHNLAMQGQGNFGQGQPTPQGVTNIHVNPQTGAKIGWDGTKWVSLQ